jgi:glyoxylase-like metal-dependent hydrolase (beta-lactamase superfamily II)
MDSTACSRLGAPGVCGCGRRSRRAWLLAGCAFALSACAKAPRRDGLSAGLPPTNTALEPLPLQQVAPDVYFVQGLSSTGSAANGNFISNAGFVVGEQGVLVVDGLGARHLALRLIQAIRQVTALPMSHLVVTHYHADHIYGLQAFREAGVRILAHGGARAYLASDTARQRLAASREQLAPWVDSNTRMLDADQWLGDGDTVLNLGGAQAIVRHLGPAHTPEDLAVYLPRQRVLFAGDLVFRGRVPWVGQADTRRWVQALNRMLAFQPQVLLPGHGAASADAATDLATTRDYLVFLRQAMGRAARDMQPFDEAYAATDWRRWEALPLFGVSNRINAYNVYLQMEHEAP